MERHQGAQPVEPHFGIARVRNGGAHESGGPFYMRLDYTEDELYRKIAEMPMDFKAGEEWTYRDTNYVLLAF
jgi:CubicO group peptidase (beta-lactamase class C family)